MPSTGLDIQTHQPVRECVPGLLTEKGPPRMPHRPWPPEHTHPSTLSSLHHSGPPNPVRVFVWSGNQGVWERKAFVLPPLCFLQPGGLNHVSAISVSHLPSPSGSPSGTPIQAALLWSTTAPLMETLQGLLEAGSWLWQKVQGFQLESSYSTHLTFTYLEIQTTRKRTRRHWPTSSWYVTPMTRNSSRMPMLFNGQRLAERAIENNCEPGARGKELP